MNNISVTLFDKQKKMLLFVIIVLFRFCLDSVYKVQISPVYAYNHLEYNPSETSMLVSWVILLFLSYSLVRFLPNRLVTSTVLICSFFMGCVPFTSYIGNLQQDSSFILAQTLFWFFYLTVPAFIKIPHIRQVSSPFLVHVLTVVLLLSILIVSGVYRHFHIDWSFLRLDFSEVYDARLEARDFNIPTLLLYIWSAAENAVPILLIYYFLKGKKWIACFIGVCLLLNFSIDGSKSVLFKLVLALLLYITRKKIDIIYLCWFFLGVVFISILEYILFDSSFLSYLIVRRLFFIPKAIDVVYFDYISSHGPLFFSHGIENGQSVQFIVTDLYFGGNGEGRANNGLFSDAFMNLYWPGLFIYPIIYAVFLFLCDKLSENLRKDIVYYGSFLIAFTLLSSEFTTSLLTHGIVVLCLILYCIPRTKEMVLKR